MSSPCLSPFVQSCMLLLPSAAAAPLLLLLPHCCCCYPIAAAAAAFASRRYAPEVGFRYDGLYRVVELLFDSAEPPESLCRGGDSRPPTPPAAGPAPGGKKGETRMKLPTRGSSRSSSNGETGSVSSDSDGPEKRQETSITAASSPLGKQKVPTKPTTAAAAATEETDGTEETDIEMLSYTQTKARSRETAAAAAAAAGGAARPLRQEERHLKGRCIFKFLLLAIHAKQYAPPRSRWRRFALDDMSHPLWDSDKRLR